MVIQNGGTLIGSKLIQFTGTFQIDDGGKYVHDDYTSIGTNPGNSIWGGTEIFAAHSTVEIQDWLDTNPLPAGITWGNLVINVLTSLNGTYWVQGANITTIQGNLQIVATAFGGQQFQFTFTTNTDVNLTIGGDLIVDGGVLNIKNGTNAGKYCRVQVNGNVVVNGGTLNLGMADAVKNADLKFKGNFTAAVGATITSGDNNSFLVANGTSAQTLSCTPAMICNFRVDPGAILNQSGSITTGNGKQFAILGIYNDNGFSKTFGGIVDVAGGTFNATGSVAMSVNRMRVGTGDGGYLGGSAGWQSAIGTRGRINFTGNAITFTQIGTATLSVGSLAEGDVYMVNSIISFITGGSKGSVTLNSGSVLSIDGGSYITGGADYASGGGTLRIGSPDGITNMGNTTTGNIRVGGNKVYNSIGSFEYFGTVPQVTGDGLPTKIANLKINNSSGMGTSGVSLSKTDTITGVLDLSRGKLTSLISEILVVADNATAIHYTDTSFVYGRMKKIGNDDFEFPVGEGAEIHKIALLNYSGETTLDEFQVEYNKGNAGLFYPAPLDTGLHHMSSLEWWTVNRISTGGVLRKKVQLQATSYTDATNLISLRVIHYNGPSKWFNNGNTANSGALSVGTVTSDSVSTYGQFTFGSKVPYPENPLPLKLIAFDVSKMNNTKASINWELATCCSAAAKFEVQRSEKSNGFVTVGTIGGSATNLFYNYIDNGLKNGINYYRLKMIDEDGKITYSKIAAVMNGVDGLMLTSLMPTVVTNNATLIITSSSSQKLDIIITDMQGRLVKKKNYSVVAGNNNIELPMYDLPSGIYQLTGISSGGKTNTIRFIK